MRAKIKIDSFLLGLVAMVLLALIWPAPGVSGGVLHFDYVTTYGVSVVFFLYGLTLAPDKMKAGLLQWKVHLIVQLATFILFPIIVIAAQKLIPGALPNELWVGFFYVAALPSTVSSSVAMTNIARGNVPVAVFNASLSSFIGVVITPIWLSWYLQSNGISMPLLPVVAKVVLLVLLPIIAGQIARHWLAAWAHRNSKWIKLADRVTILAIVYNSFCDSVDAGVWSAQELGLVIEMAVGAVVLFGIVYVFLDIVCKILGFTVRDRIATLFCGSKKSLATGAPLAKVVFGNLPGLGSSLGLIIAPIMVYHFLQLVIVSFIAARFAERADI